VPAKLRSPLAVLAGVVAGAFVIALFEFLGQHVYPPPAGMDPRNPESIRAAMAHVPKGALFLVLVAWSAGSVVGGALAARIAPRRPVIHALVVGGLLLAAGVMTMLELPHPGWFQLAGVATFLPAAWAGSRLVRRPPTSGGAPAAA